MEQLPQLAQLVRYFILVSTSAAGSGHPTSSLSAVELMVSLLFGGFFRFDLDSTDNPHNDRLIFSKGHAAPLLYALYAAAGKVTESELKTLRQFSSALEGHPTPQFQFTEAATGSLGQGLSVGVGMALNAKYLDKSPSKTFVLLGDSEMAEGQVWEAIQLASYYSLNNLVGIIDVNRLGQRGQTMVGHDVHSFAYKLRAFGWETILVDGHNSTQISAAYQRALESKDKPVMIVAKTRKGKGVSLWENLEGWHSKTLDKDQLAKALQELGPVNTTLRGIVRAPSTMPSDEVEVTDTSPHQLVFDDSLVATKKAIGIALAALGNHYPELVVLDAEVSNSTHTELFKQRFPHRFFEMFIAEQNMVSVAVGLAKRGKLPVVSSFAAFLTRTFDQIRMAQYSNTRMVVYGSYAGVSIGMDGASQMGLEDIAMMRSILHSTILYPSDAWSAVKMTELALQQSQITYLRGTREPTPLIYSSDHHFEVGGSHVLRSSSDDVATIVAAGITVHEALKAYELLYAEGVIVRVIDLYSIKPVDVNTLRDAAAQTKLIVTVEDHYPEGGIGDVVKVALSGVKTPVESLAVLHTPRSGKPSELLDYEGINAAAIVQAVKLGIEYNQVHARQV